MDDLALALSELKALQRELAVVQDLLAGPRMRWRRVRDDIAADILTLDPVACEVVAWRPMGARNIATLDAERARFIADVGDMPDREKTLKAAIRVAEIDVKAARKASEQPAKPAPKSRPQTPETHQMRLF
jgi:hypothetical protein